MELGLGIKNLSTRSQGLMTVMIGRGMGGYHLFCMYSDFTKAETPRRRSLAD